MLARMAEEYVARKWQELLRFQAPQLDFPPRVRACCLDMPQLVVVKTAYDCPGSVRAFQSFLPVTMQRRRRFMNGLVGWSESSDEPLTASDVWCSDMLHPLSSH